LEASPPKPGEAVAPTQPSPATAAGEPIVAASLSDPPFAERTQNLVTPGALQDLVAAQTAHPRPLRAEVECMAKVVYHEAANQALQGQLAVAQVILNRATGANGAPTFPKSVCGVVNQQGQFFQTRRYKVPAGDGARWRTAVAIAFIAQERRLTQVAPGALFYHAAFARPAWSHQRQRIAQIGDQIFYR
jgi:spore germination cell wall hydrolase CwlJ-like protein